jgi:hypothetical protein
MYREYYYINGEKIPTKSTAPFRLTPEWGLFLITNYAENSE